jgi:hypothetical protein
MHLLLNEQQSLKNGGQHRHVLKSQLLGVLFLHLKRVLKKHRNDHLPAKEQSEMLMYQTPAVATDQFLRLPLKMRDVQREQNTTFRPQLRILRRNGRELGEQAGQILVVLVATALPATH